MRAVTAPSVFAVMGAGNSGFGLAADLAIRGFETRLFELPEFAAAVAPIAAGRQIRLRGIRGEGAAHLSMVTTDAAAAVRGADAIFVTAPAYGHRRMAEALAPHVRDGDLVVVLPGNFGGALEVSHVIREQGNASPVVVAEAASFIFACKKDGPDSVWIRGLKQGLPLAALPASATGAVLDRLADAYPEFIPARNVLDVSLNNINHPIHPPAMLLNLGRIEKTGGDWSFFHEGMTPAVCRLMEGLDAERLAVAGAFGLPRISTLEWTTRMYGHQGFGGATLYEALSTTPVHGAARAPSSVDHRYFTEDVPYGLVPIASGGRAIGVPAPITEAVVAVCSAVAGRDFAREGRTIESLGLGGLTVDQILAHVEGTSPLPARPTRRAARRR
jgi:opine dehydrogenase